MSGYLYLPQKSETKPPLLVWIHGGGWTKGSKSSIHPTFIRLTAEGYAAASIDYRLDGLTTHPTQIHDCKGAIRWLRANADKYGYDVTRIGVGGGSAGGHLVLLLGWSSGVEELEGHVGGNVDQSSQVHAVVDLCGPGALGLFAEESERFRQNKTSERLKSASPVTYLSKDDPPVLVFHGDKDQLVPLSQSEHLHKRYQEMGLESSLHIIEGAGHGGPQFSDPTRYELVKEFFVRHIKQATAEGGWRCQVSMNITVIEDDLLDQVVDVIVNAWNRNIIPRWLLHPRLYLSLMLMAYADNLNSRVEEGR